LKEREKSLKRVESNPRVNGTLSRNGEAPRSRSGLRNSKPVKQSLINNPRKFHPPYDPIQQENSAKPRSHGRNPKEPGKGSMPYGQANIRESSVSNNSNPTGSTLAPYPSGVAPKPKQGWFAPNALPQSFYTGVGRQNNNNTYGYNINLNAVNKSLGNSNSTTNQASSGNQSIG